MTWFTVFRDKMTRMRDRTISTPTSGQLVAAAIRRQIVLGELADGDSLPNEAALLEMYGVSRPVLREALRILQSEALLSIRRGSKGGARVNAPNSAPIAQQAGYLLQHQHTTIADVFQARAIIEPPAVHLLAKERDPQVLKRLQQAIEDEEAARPHDKATAYGDFHTLVVELSGSRTLAMFAEIMAEITRRHTQAVMRIADLERVNEDATVAHRVHHKLVKLVEKGDADAAEALWRSHLEETADVMLAGRAGQEIVDLFA